MLQTIQILLMFTFPFLILAIRKRFKNIKMLSPILLAYAFGITWGNIQGLPLDRSLSMTISEVSIPIAIPLILFSADFIKWLKSAKKTVISFVLVMLSAFISALLAAWIFRETVGEFAKISGMMIGVYTGGTPNLMAVGKMLEISDNTLILANASDVILGGLYFLLLISIIKPVLSKILPPYKSDSKDVVKEVELEPFASFDKNEKTKAVGKVMLAILTCIIALAVSVGIALLLTGKMNAAIIMMGVTSVGVGLSFVKRIKEIRFTYEAGQYIILVFSIALGTTVDIQEMFKASPRILAFVAVAMFGAIFIHLIFSKIFKIDVDTAIITSTAGIYGPAFVIPVAEAINNKEVVVAGLTAGLVGYALGNYLGLLVYSIANLF